MSHVCNQLMRVFGVFDSDIHKMELELETGVRQDKSRPVSSVFSPTHTEPPPKVRHTHTHAHAHAHAVAYQHFGDIKKAAATTACDAAALIANRCRSQDNCS